MQSAFFTALLVASASALPACPEIYAPVCGSLNGVQLTYGNECEANGAGAKILSQGSCVETINCTKIYAPVCHRACFAPPISIIKFKCFLSHNQMQ
ncbi:hypothetical protein HDV02_005273 [Globomyces sp. JEL0801]|nr:hypothetical protein HDV02_005273 [Globomyces sp. JEL0801]